jgi:hypothetical protein
MREKAHRVTVLALLLAMVSSAFFFVKVSEANLLLDNLIDVAVTQTGVTDTADVAASLAGEIYRRTNRGLNAEDLDWYSRLEGTSFFGVSSAAGLQYGFYGIVGHSQYGSCGTMSRTLLNALWKLGIPARKLQLVNNAEGKGGGHTLVEFYYNGAWRVISPADGAFVWRTEHGEIATARQIQSDPQTFSQIYAVQPGYPYLFDDYKHIRWSKLPTWLTATIRAVIGENRFNAAETPRLYDRPRTLFLYCSILASVLLALIAYVLRPQDSRPRGGCASEPGEFLTLGLREEEVLSQR